MQKKYYDYLYISGGMDCDRLLVQDWLQFEIDRLKSILVSKSVGDLNKVNRALDVILAKIYDNRIDDQFVNKVKANKTLTEVILTLNYTINDALKSHIYDKLKRKIAFRMPKDFINLESEDTKLILFVQETAKEALNNIIC
jgi:hypothetical protein